MGSQVSMPSHVFASRGKMLAGNVMVDYAKGVIDPCTSRSVAYMLARVFRYGVHAPLRADVRCSALVHSMLMGRMADHLRSFGVDEVTRSVVMLYSSLHDIGEVIGGDFVAMLPTEVTASLRQWQSDVRKRMLLALGLPEPSGAIKAWVKVLDLVVLLPELVAAGRAVSLEDAAELCDATLPWKDLVKEAMEKAGCGQMSFLPLAQSGTGLLETLAPAPRRFPTTERAVSLWMENLRLPYLVLYAVDDTLVAHRQFSSMDVNPVLGAPDHVLAWGISHGHTWRGEKRSLHRVAELTSRAGVADFTMVSSP